MKQYTAKVSRDGKFWLVHVPEIDRYTQARNLREVDTMAADLVEVMTGEAADTFEIRRELEIPVTIRQRLAKVDELRERAAAEQREAARQWQLAAAELKNDGLPLRDIGAVLNISYQRAAQLVSGDAVSEQR